MEYNGEDIRKAQMEQRQRILKSFGETNLFSGEGDSNKLMRSMEKAEENDIEKAKHQDGDMHPNGRWVWRQSANGGKGDWRVANPKRGGGSRAAASAAKTTSSEGDKKGNSFYNKKLTDLTDEEFNKIYEDSKKMYHQILMNKNINETSRQSAESAMKKLEDEKKRRKGDGKKQTNSNSVTHDINGTKVTVTKNNDGSYTLEAKGKKVKSDDPSFFVNGANLKPRVKKALAKEVGIDSDTTIQNKKR